MPTINKKNIVATMLVYGIARGVIEELKPNEDAESVATDDTVFAETMKALNNKEVEVNRE